MNVDVNTSSAGSPGNEAEEKIPKRDWVRLPALSLLTMCLLVISTELIARKLYSASTTRLASCLVLDDPSTGPRGVPNCVCSEKLPESSWIEYRLNHCGHRAGTECGAKPPGAYRIVMTGSSVAMGERVQQEESFAALLPIKLSSETGHTVQLYNESIGWGFSHNTDLRFNEVLAAKPDLILWILTPMDIQRSSFSLPAKTESVHGTSGTLPQRALRFLAARCSESGTVLLLRHLLYQSSSIFTKSHLMGGDDGTGNFGGEDGTGFLRVAQGSAWNNHLQQFDRDAMDIERRSKASGIPIVVTLVPDRVQAAMISKGEWPQGYDPYKLNGELRDIVVRHGGTYLDILADFRAVPTSEQYYFPVDGHPNARGHALISELLAKELTRGAVPALKTASQLQLASGEGR